MLHKYLKPSSLTLLVLPLLLAACGSTVQPKYYLLTPDNSTSVSSPQKQLLISVGPVSLPAYLDRSQIVTRRGDIELDMADAHRWAEPLQKNFSRVLAEDLNNQMGAGKVIVWPAKEFAPVDYRVAVNVERFDSTDQGDVLLVATWSIYDGKVTGTLESQRSEYRLDIGPDPAYPDLVTALSRTVNLLSKDIFKAINDIKHPE